MNRFDLPMNATAELTVRELSLADFSRWDDFVLACPQATFFHRAGWKTVIEKAFGHRCTFLYAEAGGRIEGILPLAEVKSLLFGHSLVSLPFCVYAGIAAVSERAYAALDQAAQALAAKLKVEHLEYRALEARHPDWAHKELYVTFRKEILPDVEANMLAIPRKQRAMVRKAIKLGLEGHLDDGIERFFLAYSTSVHRLGTPVFAKKYFRILREVFGKDCDVLTITRGDDLVASFELLAIEKQAQLQLPVLKFDLDSGPFLQPGHDLCNEAFYQSADDLVTFLTVVHRNQRIDALTHGDNTRTSL